MFIAPGVFQKKASPGLAVTTQPISYQVVAVSGFVFTYLTTSFWCEYTSIPIKKYLMIENSTYHSSSSDRILSITCLVRPKKGLSPFSMRLLNVPSFAIISPGITGKAAMNFSVNGVDKQIVSCISGF